jgi:hypothetical protein
MNSRTRISINCECTHPTTRYHPLTDLHRPHIANEHQTRPVIGQSQFILCLCQVIELGLSQGDMLGHAFREVRVKAFDDLCAHLSHRCSRETSPSWGTRRTRIRNPTNVHLLPGHLYFPVPVSHAVSTASCALEIQFIDLVGM